MHPKYPFSFDEFKAIYTKVPRLTVDLIIQSAEGILLTKRSLSSWRGQWHLPGGTVYYKETIEQAVKRVAKEEVHVDVTIEKQLGYIEYFSEEKERGFGWTISIAIACRIIDGIPLASEQGSEPTFFTSLPEPIVEEQKAFLLKNFSFLH